VIAAEQGKLGGMFDVILDEVRKYSPTTRKLKAKAKK
jgi:hypothetical protein